VASGYFGCRDAQGFFDAERFAANAADPQVKMIELKLSQGAKPGHGGVLPGPKVTPEIAAARGVPVGQDCVSPAAHSAFATPVLSGDDFTWLPLLSVGATGVISVLSNVAPRLTVAVWEAWRQGNVAEAARIHRQLYPLVRYLFAQSNPVPVKAALAAMGLCRAECRLPLTAGKAPAPELLVGLS
ncbi:MAG TPA: dihydrodipicolinate synthase family protein, partial [Myxococcota bacterium]|nr:dihydrodipicolinate synthase family protein [Myxococcota bacterium]